MFEKINVVLQNRRKDRFHLPEFTLRHYNTQRLVCAVSDEIFFLIFLYLFSDPAP